MAKFGDDSLKQLKNIDARLQQILNIAIKIIDLKVVCGHRSTEEQGKLFKQGRKHDGIGWYIDNKNAVLTNCDGFINKSKHNQLPAKAVDIVPYPSMWSDNYKFYYLAGVIMTIAWYLKIPLKWGGEFKTFKDFPHFEIDEK